jgi:hypothetical protein
MADPRSANAKAFKLDGANYVVGIELQYVPMPSAPYECVKAEFIDEIQSNLSTVANLSVRDADGYETAERVWLAWPYPNVNYQDPETRGLPGNPNHQHMITSGFKPPAIGPLQMYVGDANGQPISDIIGGLGLPYNHHVCFNLIWKWRGVIVPPVEPGVDPDPQAEPIAPVGELADKSRWYLEESIRLYKANQAVRAMTMQLRLVDREAGLFYRLERALKAGWLTG